jgi:hypothetical protein
MATATLDTFAEEASVADEVLDTPGSFGKGKEHTGKFGYWRKAETYDDGSPCPDGGFIVTGPAWPMERLRQMDKGMVFLRQYGVFDIEEGGINSGLEKFRRILTNGGAKEFPVRQVVEMGWHRPQGLPRYARRAKFPQIKGVEINDAECKVCHRVFSSLGDAQALLGKHESIAHRETSQSNNLVRGLKEAQEGAQGPLGEMLDTIRQQVEQQGINAAASADAIKQLASAVVEMTKQQSKRSP